MQIVSGDKKATRDIVIVEFNASAICAVFWFSEFVGLDGGGHLVSQLTAQQKK